MRPRRLDPDRVVEHLPRLFRAARAWTDSREDAEDLVQETCARVLAKTRLLVNEDEIGYLMRAMRNTLVSQRRAASRRPALAPLPDDDDSPIEVAGPPHDDPSVVAETDEVFAVIARLPEDFRDALVAIDVAGLSYQEAARLLGVAEGTITSRLYRARDRVAQRLGKGETEPGPRADPEVVRRPRTGYA